MLRGKGMQGAGIRVYAGEDVRERRRISASSCRFASFSARRLSAPARKPFRSISLLRLRRPQAQRRDVVLALPLFRFALRLTS